MPSTRLRGVLAAIGLLALLGGPFVAASIDPRVSIRDRNGDGRPDLWQYRDDRGALVRQNLDTNFDGRSDVQESYDGLRLVRRESDRNFDDRIDLTEEFDAVSGERTRSIVDVDFDGRADLLILFEDGRPVFSQWAPAHEEPARAAVDGSLLRERRGDDALRALMDPFVAAHRLSASVSHQCGAAACPEPTGIPPALAHRRSTAPARPLPCERPVPLRSSSLTPASPRGPPTGVAVL